MNALPPEFIPPDPTIPRVFYTGSFPRPPQFGEARHKYVRVAERLDCAIDRIISRVRVSPSSRVVLWSKAIRRLAAANKRHVLEQIVVGLQRREWNHPFRESFVALSESRMFIEIVEQLLDHLTDRDLRELISGHSDPSLDNVSARGRDKEFEWFLAALFRRGGLTIALAEPDILIQLNGEVRSIAAKRLSSRKRLKSNIKKAADQISTAGYPGYIFLEATRLIDPDVHFIEHWRDRGRAVGTRLNGLAHMPISINRRNEGVQGVVLRAAFPLVSPGFEYGTSERWVGVGVHKGPMRVSNIELMDVLLSGARGV